MRGSVLKLTEFLAVYAAALSTAVFFWNVHKARPAFRVKMIFGVDKVDGEYVHGVYAFVQNHSSHKVHITNLSVLYPFKKTTVRERLEHLWKFRRLPRRIGWCHTSLDYYDTDSGCPITLEPGTAHSVLIQEDAVEKILESSIDRRLMAVAQDALWRNVYSAPFEYPMPPDKQLEASDTKKAAT